MRRVIVPNLSLAGFRHSGKFALTGEKTGSFRVKNHIKCRFKNRLTVNVLPVGFVTDSHSSDDHTLDSMDSASLSLLHDLRLNIPIRHLPYDSLMDISMHSSGSTWPR
jgi:hypothetical protein